MQCQRKQPFSIAGVPWNLHETDTNVLVPIQPAPWLGARAYPRLHLYTFLASAGRISCGWVVFGCDVSRHATVHTWSCSPLSETLSGFCDCQVKVPEIFSALLVAFPVPHPCKLAEAAPGPKTHQLTALHCACHCSHTISHSQGLQRLCPTSDQKFVPCWHCHHPMAVQWVSLLVTGWIVPAHLWLCIPTLRFSPLLCLGQRLLKLAQVPNDYSEPLEKLSSKSSLLLSCQIRKSPDQLCVWQVLLPLHKTAIGSNPAAYPPLSSEPSPLQPPFFLSADLIPATLDAKDTKQTSGGMLCNCLSMLLHS